MQTLGFIANWIERRFALRASADLLDLYRKVRRANPELTGRPLYEAIAAQRLGSRSGEAATAVRRADESFAQWPRDRDLRFRDVAHLLIFDEYTRANGNRAETRTMIGQSVARVIPAEL